MKWTKRHKIFSNNTRGKYFFFKSKHGKTSYAFSFTSGCRIYRFLTRHTNFSFTDIPEVPCRISLRQLPLQDLSYLHPRESSQIPPDWTRRELRAGIRQSRSSDRLASFWVLSNGAVSGLDYVTSSCGMTCEWQIRREMERRGRDLIEGLLLCSAKPSFLGMLANLRKATIGFVMSLCPSVRLSVSASVRTEQLRSQCTDFHEAWYCNFFFSEICAGNTSYTKIWQE